VAFAELRLRLAWQRLRGRGGVPELISRIVMYVVAVPAGLVFAAMAGAASFRGVRAGRGLAVDVAVAGLFFGVWQTWTAVSLSLAERETLDLRRLLVYPIAPWRIWTYGLASSVVGDPFAVFWCLLLAGSFAGATAGRPGAWLVLLAVVMALFVLATVALVALLQELLARMLRRRRSREIAIAALYVAIGIGLAVLSGAGPRIAIEAIRTLGRVRWIVFPPALAAEAGKRLFRGDPAGALPWMLALAALTLATSWAAYRLALAAARSGGEATGAAAEGGRSWGLPGALGALVEKEAKYVLRHPLASVLAVVLPAISALVAWKVAPRIPEEAGEVVRALPLFAFVLYTHMAVQPFWLNAFGWDRGGSRAFFLAPVRGADVVLAKNLAALALAVAIFAASAGASIAVGGPPPAWALAGAAALHLGLAPWLLSAGNLVSILNPRVAPLALQRGGAMSTLSALAGMLIVSLAAGLFSVPVLVALELDDPWVLVGAWAGLGGLGLAVYLRTLPRVGALLARRREPLLEAVSGDAV
jgi:ABC-2 type transport system permease protein